MLIVAVVNLMETTQVRIGDGGAPIDRVTVGLNAQSSHRRWSAPARSCMSRRATRGTTRLHQARRHDACGDATHAFIAHMGERSELPGELGVIGVVGEVGHFDGKKRARAALSPAAREDVLAHADQLHRRYDA